MKTVWTQHITDKGAKDEFAASVRMARPVLERLQDILRKDLDALCEIMESDDFYKSPNLNERWLRLLAQRAELRRIINLIEI